MPETGTCSALFRIATPGNRPWQVNVPFAGQPSPQLLAEQNGLPANLPAALGAEILGCPLGGWLSEVTHGISWREIDACYSVIIVSSTLSLLTRICDHAPTELLTGLLELQGIGAG